MDKHFWGALLWCMLPMTLILTAPTVHAVSVMPLSYAFDQPTNCGGWCYNDNLTSYVNSSIGYPDTFVKLTDGIVGNGGWALQQGREWVGWADTPAPNIDFNFGTLTHIDAVSIGTTQDNPGDVVLPSINIYEGNGNSWTFVQSLVVPPSTANDRNLYDPSPHIFLNLTGLGIDAQYIRIAPQYNGPWIFIDEVQFQGPASTVPEPSTWLLLSTGCGGLLGYGWRRHRTV